MRLSALRILSVFAILGVGASPASAKARASEYTAADLLKIFDELDFVVYSTQQWDRLAESHAEDIVVTYPDGHKTTGIKSHIEELQPMFVFAPDTKIKVHPIKFATREWTCVTGEISGTFSRPMPIGDGKTIPPTGKTFKLNMATIGHWKNGKMIEEQLFWDNQAFMKQIGLAK